MEHPSDEPFRSAEAGLSGEPDSSGAAAAVGAFVAPGVSVVARGLGEVRDWPRSFGDRLGDGRGGRKEVFRAVRECAVRPPAHTLSEVAALPVERGGVPDVGPGALSVTWAGHASWVIRLGGLTVLTDPVWSRRIPATPARVTPVGVPWAALPPVDAVVISHNHYDHLDAPTIKRLPRGTALFVPAGLGAWFRRRGFTRVTELDWWEAAELCGVRFDFVPAHHWSRRTLTDGCRSLWGGWVLSAAAATGDGPTGRAATAAAATGTVAPGGAATGAVAPGAVPGHRVYFAGDTGYGPCFGEIARAHPAIDLALLPIGAYSPRWMLRRAHTDPEEAVRAFLDVGAAAMAPMHWATFLLSSEPPLEPLTRLLAAWEAAGLPRDALWDLPVGASRVLDRVSAGTR